MKIILCCVQGMSTGMMVVKMKKAAEEKGLDADIHAYAISEIDDVGKDSDIILLGPQVRFQLDSIKAKFPEKKVMAIDPLAYGMMDGKKVIEAVLKELA